MRAEQRIRVEYLSYQRQYERLFPKEAVLLEESLQPSRFAALEAEIYGTHQEEANEITRYLAEPRVAPAANPLD